VLSGELAGLRKLFSQRSPVSDAAGLVELAAALAPAAGLDEPAALAYLTEFAAEAQRAVS
jgi:hypothetical protein